MLKEALKTQTVDGQIFDSTDSSIKIYNDIDLSDESIIDMDIPFSDILANYARLKERDLNKWRASIEKVRSTKVSFKPTLQINLMDYIHYNN